ncbi:MAG: sigma-70 family RNA polymerase sigma factor [Planctomycetaceae bacterium]|nr:ECF RNA polymerase sigma factor SigH [Planctomycetota bacterium]MCQ3948602.1 RNA polymerase subunit sigma [Planctomycetota bacterium]NUO15289.1 sigma-70 family RNA polymerase sigma factor [Planctomycetaceae bacterium]GIK52065.1 MAG: RNA polymerase sigma factor RpoE [Planctomycetota bacterium]HRJ77355.1 sigma-70 family RNA polymerase sigma factor [Planctomycetota bacterium]
MVATYKDLREDFAREALPLHDVLYRQAMHLTRNAENAEDLVQETYLHAFDKFESFERGTNLKAWLARILFNLFVNQYRRSKKAGPQVEISSVEPFLGEEAQADSEAESESPEQIMRNERFLNSLEGPVRRELESLDHRFRDVLLLNSVGGESYADIAEKLEVPIGTVMSRLHRAKATMRERLAETKVGS